jgi:16S rRNA (guanine(966)-N(2))-methyltransferase RsmD
VTQRAAERGAGRVIAGSARGLRLTAPATGARPLGDRLKEALFAILEPEIRGQSFLDLFSGSGAGGIEALSRGAGRAVFVDRSADAFAATTRNLQATRLAAGGTIVRGDAMTWLHGAGRSAGPFRAILVDPPYDEPELIAVVLEEIAAAGPGVLLATDGVVVVKHSRRLETAARIGLLASVRERQFGESGLTFLRWQADEETG